MSCLIYFDIISNFTIWVSFIFTWFSSIYPFCKISLLVANISTTQMNVHSSMKKLRQLSSMMSHYSSMEQRWHQNSDADFAKNAMLFMNISFTDIVATKMIAVF